MQPCDCDERGIFEAGDVESELRRVSIDPVCEDTAVTLFRSDEPRTDFVVENLEFSILRRWHLRAKGML